MAHIFLCLSLLAVCLTACSQKRLFPILYSAQEIKATIVDASTGEPLQGVVVLASWVQSDPSYFSSHDIACDQLVNLVSATTNQDGVFDIPAWKDKPGYCDYMGAWQPRVLLYKPGYEALWLGDKDENFHDETTYAYTAKVGDTSRWNGQTIKMTPLGPHRIGSAGSPGSTGIFSDDFDADIYVDNLDGYGGSLGSILLGIQPPECFWQQARPAILMLLEEERRLRPYTRQGFDFMDTQWMDESGSTLGRRSGKSCGDHKAYLDSLETEANKVQPDIPVQPYAVDFRPIKPSDEIPALPAMPRADWLPGGVDTKVSHGRVVYYVMLDPNNPYYAQVSQLFPLKANLDRIKNASLDSDWSTLIYHNIHDYYCGTYFYFERVDASHRNPDQQYVCTWIIAFGSLNVGLGMPGQSDSHYIYVNGYWGLNQYMLVRQKGLELPEDIEIDSSADLAFRTSLHPVGPHRWALPASGTEWAIEAHKKTDR